MRLLTGTLFTVSLCLTMSLGVRAAETFAAVLDPYFRIQSALVDDQTGTIKADAAELADKARALGADGTPIAAAAAELGAASDLVQARAAFGKLSDAVIAYADSTRANPGDGVETMYRPMAKKSWLQRGETVRNPYYGKAMPDCGMKKKAS
jgi:hypothetical protein